MNRMGQSIRSALVLAVGGALIVVVASQTKALDRWLAKDFLEYWAAGRLNLRGENPYDPALVLREQRSADPERGDAVMMWNPPPSLAVYMPVAVLPANWAALLWVCVQLLCVFTATKTLWRVYAPGAPPWPAAALSASSLGTWWLVAYGQNTGLILLGLAGFLHFTKEGRPYSAGACAALTALKPHLLAVLGVLILADAFTRRGGKALAAGAAAICAALGVACATNPQVVAQFAEAVRHPAEGATPLSEWMLPVPAFWLRDWIAPDRFWVQFVPCAVACAGFLAYRAWRGSGRDWSRELPSVVGVSVMASPYGGWLFDLPVLLVPVTWAAARLFAAKQWPLFGAFLLGQAAVTYASFARPAGLHEYWWAAPASLALCLVAFAVRPQTFLRTAAK